jgi:16S rRNA (cytosine1402-N4)-methyltransferase
MAGLVVDGTFGAGGYSRAILDAGAQVIGIDQDKNVQQFADDLSAEYGDRFSFVMGRFSELDELAKRATDQKVDAVVLDIGVSSMQLDEGERGFSFMRDGPLDMRMGANGPSAADFVIAPMSA